MKAAPQWNRVCRRCALRALRTHAQGHLRSSTVMETSWLKEVSQLKRLSKLQQDRGMDAGPSHHQRRGNTPTTAMEALDRRVMLTVTASFSQGVLTVTGDAQNNSLAVSRD